MSSKHFCVEHDPSTSDWVERSGLSRRIKEQGVSVLPWSDVDAEEDMRVARMWLDENDLDEQRIVLVTVTMNSGAFGIEHWALGEWTSPQSTARHYGPNYRADAGIVGPFIDRKGIDLTLSLSTGPLLIVEGAASTFWSKVLEPSGARLLRAPQQPDRQVRCGCKKPPPWAGV